MDAAVAAAEVPLASLAPGSADFARRESAQRLAVKLPAQLAQMSGVLPPVVVSASVEPLEWSQPEVPVGPDAAPEVER